MLSSDIGYKKEIGRFRPSILVVDDDPTNLQLLVNTLEDKYDVFVATSGEEALD